MGEREQAQAELISRFLTLVGKLVDRKLDDAIGDQVSRLDEIDRRVERLEVWPRERDAMRPGYDA